MFLTLRYLRRLERERKEAEAKAEAKGIAEKIVEAIVDKVAEGIAMGKAEERELWIAWNDRRLIAEAMGEDFNEPPPSGTQQKKLLVFSIE